MDGESFGPLFKIKQMMPGARPDTHASLAGQALGNVLSDDSASPHSCSLKT